MVTSVNSKMTAIADAIRNLLDISGTMGLDAMASNISSITKRGAVAGTISTKSEQYIIPAGYHNGNGTVGIDVAEQAKITAENIKNGVTILGVSGTASGDTYAFIGVTYPAGSICTCSYGTTTLTARDTSGKALFSVPSAGTWTVQCYDGADYDSSANKKSAYVEITSEGQSESVALSYELVLFDGGVVEPWTVIQARPTAAIDTTIYLFASDPERAVVSAVRTTNKIDLSSFSVLKYTVTENRSQNTSFMCVTSSPDAPISAGSTNNPTSDVVAYGKPSATGTYEVNISTIAGEYYISTAIGHYGSNGIKISKVWLE